MRLFPLFLASWMAVSPLFAGVADRAVPQVPLRYELTDQALTLGLSWFSRTFSRKARLESTVPLIVEPDRNELLREAVQDVVLKLTGKPLTEEHASILKEFLDAPRFENFSPRMIAEMNYGKAIYEWQWGQKLLPIAQGQTRPLNWGNRIGPAMNRPSFEQLIGPHWPRQAPWPRDGNRTLGRLLFVFVQELDPSGEAAKKLAAPYVDPIIEKMQTAPPHTRSVNSETLVQFANTRLARVLNYYAPHSEKLTDWLNQNYSSAQLNVNQDQGTRLNLEQDRLRALIGDSIQDLLICREIVRQNRIQHIASPDRLRSQLQSAEGQEAVVDTIFKQLGRWPLKPMSRASKSTFFEDVICIVYGYYVEQQDPRPLEQTNRMLVTMYRTHLMLQRNAPADLRRLIDDWDVEATHAQRHMPVSGRIEKRLQRIHDREKQILVRTQRAYAEGDYAPLIHLMTELLEKEIPKLPVLSKIRGEKELRKPVREKERTRALELLAAIAAHNGDTVSPSMLNKPWFADFVNTMDHVFQTLGSVPRMMVTARRASSEWTKDPMWEAALNGFSDAVYLSFFHSEIRYYRSNKNNNVDAKSLISLILLQRRPHLARRFIQMIDRLSHRYEAKHQHDVPEWIRTLRQQA